MQGLLLPHNASRLFLGGSGSLASSFRFGVLGFSGGIWGLRSFTGYLGLALVFAWGSALS